VPEDQQAPKLALKLTMTLPLKPEQTPPLEAAHAASVEPEIGEFSFIYRYIARESCSQFGSLPLTYLTIEAPESTATRWQPIDELTTDVQAQLRIGGGDARPAAQQQHACARTGALTVHSLGALASDPTHSRWFTTDACIVPIGFSATRLHWDWSAPNARALYELAVCDIATLPAELRTSVLDIDAALSVADAASYAEAAAQEQVEHEREGGPRVRPIAPTAQLRGPLFVIKKRGGLFGAERSPSLKCLPAILSATPHGALAELRRRIDSCSEAHFAQLRRATRTRGLLCLDRARTSSGETMRQPRASTYGMVAAHFFGYGLPHVAAAIEALPGSAFLALPWRFFADDATEPNAPVDMRDDVAATWTRSHYNFQWRLPEQSAMDKSLKTLRLSQLEQKAANAMGCARAEGFGDDESRRRQHVAALRILDRQNDTVAPSRAGRSGKRKVMKKDKGKQRRSAAQAEQHERGGSSAVSRGGVGNPAPKFVDYVEMYRFLKSTPVRKRFEVRRSLIHGWGLFLRADYPGGFIERDSMVIEYVGEIMCVWRRHAV
jgi:hypothetical protein